MTSGIKTLAGPTTGLKFTESPRWHNGKMWFLDIHDSRIKTVDLTGSVETVLELPFIPNAFGLTLEGTLVVGDAFQRRIYRWDGGALQQVADISDITKYCLSDGMVDAKGRLYVGDIGYNFVDPAAKPVETCVIVLVGPDGRSSVVADNLFFPNGIVITPDGRTLIVAETLGNRLTAFDIQEDGSLATGGFGAVTLVRWPRWHLPRCRRRHLVREPGGRGQFGAGLRRRGDHKSDQGGHPRLCSDVGRAAAEAPLHLYVSLPRSGRNSPKSECVLPGC